MRIVRTIATSVVLLATAWPSAAQVPFGRAVAVGDGEVIVGEPASGNAFRPGRVYVYRKAGTAWREAARLTAAAPARADGFGSALALAGSTLFVGQGANAITVFTRPAGGGAWKASGQIAVPAAEGSMAGPMAAAGEWLP